MTIEQFLKNWKSESLFGERHFQKQNFSLVAGQELYLLSFKSIVSVDGESKLIEKHKLFQTRVQGLEISDEINLLRRTFIFAKTYLHNLKMTSSRNIITLLTMK